MTYGQQQEAAAEALRQLLTTEAVPARTEDRGQLVRVRDQLRLALLDRLTAIAQGNVTLEDRFKTERSMLNTLGYRGLGHLARIVNQTPLAHDSPDASPVEVLTQPTASPTVELWRQSTVAISIGNHDLHAALRHGITTAGSWHLLRDAAHTVEAFIILDNRLDSAGLLDGHHRPQHPSKLRARRAITATIAREASWEATDPELDNASADALEHSVQLVRDLRTLAAAQRRLAEFVRPQHAGNRSFDPYRELTLAEARPLLLAQARLADHISHAVPRELSQEFAQRRDLLLGVRRATAGLHDVTPRPPRRFLALQSGEIMHNLDRIPAWSRRHAEDVHDLNLGSGEVATQVGRALARASRRKNYTPFARYEARRNGDVLVPVILERNSRLPAACLRLISTQTKTPPGPSAASQRRALAVTLAQTPTRYRQPPYSSRRHAAPW